MDMDIDQSKRLISAGDLPNSAGGIYNPGACLYQDKIFILCRREPNYAAYSGDYYTHPVYPTLLIQNAETDRVETVSTLEQVGFVEQFGTKYRLEDFRLFEYQKTLYASHVVIFEKAPGYNRTVQVISHVDPLRSRLTFVCAPNLPIHQTQVEKIGCFLFILAV